MAQLFLSAYYVPSSDLVEVRCALIGGNNKPQDPGLLDTGSVLLRYKDAVLQQASGLSRFNATEDLYFEVRFSHPSRVTGLSVEAVLTDTSGVETRRVVPVVTAPAPAADADYAGTQSKVLQKEEAP